MGDFQGQGVDFFFVNNKQRATITKLLNISSQLCQVSQIFIT